MIAGGTALASTSATDVTKVTGLTGIPSVRGDVFDRPEADGVVEPANMYLGARIIVIEGVVWAGSVDLAWTQWNLVEKTLAQMVQTQALVKWRRGGGTLDVQAMCRVVDSQPPVLSADHQGPFIEYQVTLRADDPTIYSQVSQSASASAPASTGGMPFPLVFPLPFGSGASGGTVSATNGGNYTGWPTITIAGPIVNPVVGNGTTSKFLYFDSLTLSAGDTLTILTAPNQRSASVAGVSKLGTLRFSDSLWPSMTPGVAETWQFYAQGGGTSGATTMTIAWSDAYIS